MTKIGIYLASFLVLAVCCLASLWFYFMNSSVVTQEAGVTYYLKPGTSEKTFITHLSLQGIIQYPLVFSLYVYPQYNAHLKTGEYFFPKGSTLISIWRQVTSGTGLVYHPFIIVPGWSFSQLRHALLQAEGLRHMTAQLTDKQIMAYLGSQTVAPEGEFFPETYYYTRDIQDLIILKRAYDLMQNRLKEVWESRATGLPYKNEYEALIAASLIEKEAYLNSERPVIAGVLVNRLKKDMLLQFDPTVIYGMGERYTGKIHKENLLEDTAYNTYVHKGLPPTPIAMPGMSSLDAALHPQNNDYYYFVAKGDGSHQFSRTLPEHNDAVKSTIKSQEPNFNENKVMGYLTTQFPVTFKKLAQNNILAFTTQTKYLW
jgi:UPF0755 protein